MLDSYAVYLLDSYAFYILDRNFQLSAEQTTPECPSEPVRKFKLMHQHRKHFFSSNMLQNVTHMVKKYQDVYL